VARATFLEKFSKTYINPSPRDSGFSSPLGYTLELIPLENPANYRVGSNARFRILYKGQPLANAEVFAVYNYYDYKTLNAYEQKGNTNRNAVADSESDLPWAEVSGSKASLILRLILGLSLILNIVTAYRFILGSRAPAAGKESRVATGEGGEHAY
jgi:hypothetical protein